MKAFLAPGVKKSVSEELILIKSFINFDFLDLVKFAFLNFAKFVIIDKFSIFPSILPLLAILILLSAF